MSRPQPKFHRGQMLRNLHEGAEDIPPSPVENVIWDEHWGCYTYSFPGARLLIEESMLEATNEPDIDPDQWMAEELERHTYT